MDKNGTVSRHILETSAVVDPEICPRGGPNDSQNLWPPVSAIFVLTSFNRGRGGLGPPDPLL